MCFLDKNSESNEQLNNNFGFKSFITPPKNEHLKAFENDLYDTVRNIEFQNVKSSSKINSKMTERIKQDSKLLIPADKTYNLYRLTTDEYNQLSTEDIFKSYKNLHSRAIQNVD